MPKVVIGSNGFVQYADDSGLEVNTTVLLAKTPELTTTALTDAATLVDGGLYTVSAGTAKALTMPLASSVPGSMFIVRTASAHAHFLTGSAEAAGTKVFTDGTSSGSKLALSAIVGSSVTLVSDGVSFCVSAQSGSLAITGT